MIEKLNKYYIYIIACIVIALVIAGLVTKPDNQIAINFENNADNERIVEITYIYVDIKGAVRNPGVYKIEKNSRLFQVIQLAGGLEEDADDNAINKSIILADQDAIYIPTINDEFPNISVQENNEIGGIININTASFDALQTLPGVGPATAQNIIDYRNDNGYFETIEDIKNVSGIGESTYNQLKDFITT